MSEIKHVEFDDSKGVFRLIGGSHDKYVTLQQLNEMQSKGELPSELQPSLNFAFEQYVKFKSLESISVKLQTKATKKKRTKSSNTSKPALIIVKAAERVIDEEISALEKLKQESKKSNSKTKPKTQKREIKQETKTVVQSNGRAKITVKTKKKPLKKTIKVTLKKTSKSQERELKRQQVETEKIRKAQEKEQALLEKLLKNKSFVKMRNILSQGVHSFKAMQTYNNQYKSVVSQLKQTDATYSYNPEDLKSFLIQKLNEDRKKENGPKFNIRDINAFVDIVGIKEKKKSEYNKAEYNIRSFRINSLMFPSGGKVYKDADYSSKTLEDILKKRISRIEFMNGNSTNGQVVLETEKYISNATQYARTTANIHRNVEKIIETCEKYKDSIPESLIKIAETYQEYRFDELQNLSLEVLNEEKNRTAKDYLKYQRFVYKEQQKEKAKNDLAYEVELVRQKRIQNKRYYWKYNTDSQHILDLAYEFFYEYDKNLFERYDDVKILLNGKEETLKTVSQKKSTIYAKLQRAISVSRNDSEIDALNDKAMQEIGELDKWMESELSVIDSKIKKLYALYMTIPNLNKNVKVLVGNIRDVVYDKYASIDRNGNEVVVESKSNGKVFGENGKLLGNVHKSPFITDKKIQESAFDEAFDSDTGAIKSSSKEFDKDDANGYLTSGVEYFLAKRIDVLMSVDKRRKAALKNNTTTADKAAKMMAKMINNGTRAVLEKIKQKEARMFQNMKVRLPSTEFARNVVFNRLPVKTINESSLRRKSQNIMTVSPVSTGIVSEIKNGINPIIDANVILVNPMTGKKLVVPQSTAPLKLEELLKTDANWKYKTNDSGEVMLLDIKYDPAYNKEQLMPEMTRKIREKKKQNVFRRVKLRPVSIPDEYIKEGIIDNYYGCLLAAAMFQILVSSTPMDEKYTYKRKRLSLTKGLKDKKIKEIYDQNENPKAFEVEETVTHIPNDERMRDFWYISYKGHKFYSKDYPDNYFYNKCDIDKIEALAKDFDEKTKNSTIKNPNFQYENTHPHWDFLEYGGYNNDSTPKKGPKYTHGVTNHHSYQAPMGFLRLAEAYWNAFATSSTAYNSILEFIQSRANKLDVSKINSQIVNRLIKTNPYITEEGFDIDHMVIVRR